VLPSANSTSIRPLSVRRRSPASSGIDLDAVSVPPLRSRTAVPSTNEICAGGSAVVSWAAAGGTIHSIEAARATAAHGRM
jgi:hypothetical protein